MNKENFIKQTFLRLKTKSPKYFNYIQYVLIGIFALMEGYILFSQELGIIIPFLEAHITQGTASFVFISWLVSLLPVENSSQLNNTNMHQVFDNLNLNNTVKGIDGNSINPISAGQLPTVNSLFSVTNGILYADTPNVVTLELLNGQGTTYYSSSRPVRK